MSGAARLIAKIPAREWRGLVPQWSGGRLNFPLKCHQCGETDHWSAAQMISPQAAIPKIIQLGWDVNGKLTCPCCVTIKKKRAPSNKDKENMNKPVTPQAPNWQKKAQELGVMPFTDGQSRKNKRLVIAALEDYFDDSASCYRDGQSDKTVATELSLAEAFVQEVREELFGSLKPPSEIQELLKEMASVQLGLDNLKKRVEAIVVKNGWKS